ncbi:MAG: hypothetical protein J7647_31065 [Cyanobacteria bacterium SBLK]|nr:hypothetical protein [Cyanobacteria bacterium SBLK]
MPKDSARLKLSRYGIITLMTMIVFGGTILGIVGMTIHSPFQGKVEVEFGLTGMKMTIDRQ